jgi:hypothetical protein
MPKVHVTNEDLGARVQVLPEIRLGVHHHRDAMGLHPLWQQQVRLGAVVGWGSRRKPILECDDATSSTKLVAVQEDAAAHGVKEPASTTLWTSQPTRGHVHDFESCAPHRLLD